MDTNLPLKYPPEVWQLSGTTVHTGSCDKAGSLYSAPYSADYAKDQPPKRPQDRRKRRAFSGRVTTKRLPSSRASTIVRKASASGDGFLGTPGLFKSLKQLLEAIVPVRMSI
jgi:hypothetical protein